VKKHETRNTKHENANRSGFVFRISCFALLAALMLAPAASACPVCYGSPGDPLVKGANNGVAVLLGIIVLVQVGFAALFISFWRRARALQRRREQFHVIEGGAR
jgi:hypothetical protein